MTRTPMTLRAHLLVAFVIVAVVPILALSLALTLRVARSQESAAARRLGGALTAVRTRLNELRLVAQARVSALGDRDIPAAQVEDEADLTSPSVLHHDLPIIEILDPAGIVVASHHWPAAIGLPDHDFVFSTDGALRLQAVGEGYAYRERLTLTASHATRWRNQRLTVRGGFFLDEDFLASLATPLGMAVGLRDERHGEWRVTSESPLAAWSSPVLDPRRGQVTLDALTYRWAAEPLEAGLWIVVAIPATELDDVTRELTRLSALATAAAVLAAALAALWFSAWIARPVQRLARALPAVARGERGDPMPVTGAAEVAQLAAEFNRMTAELFESRERLLQAERVAAWREMARRLAHELKNPIFPIQVSIETLRRVFDRGAARYASGEALDNDEFGRLFRESCDTILDELRLLRGIIDEFSRFARLPQPRFAPTDIGLLVEQVLALHRPGAGLVTIETELAPGLPPILADRDLLSHALGNLVANAFEAMPDGGMLRVRTLSTAAGVAVAIEDSGPGIPEEQRLRLFTPYFTTKRGGTGLGLSIAQSIVADHGGRIEVRTEAGRSTTFTLILPSRPPVPAATRAADRQSD